MIDIENLNETIFKSCILILVASSEEKTVLCLRPRWEEALG